MGVDLFFVLSGYLITGILLDTVESKHYYRNFISRRALRIFPLYYICLAVFSTATVLGLRWQELQDWGGVGWFLVYLGNVRAAWVGTLPPMFSFAPLWSLQVEEQFYLIYPSAVLFLSRTNLRRVLTSCLFVAPALRLLLWLYVPGSQIAIYVLTPCRMDALAMGGLVAILVRSADARFSWAWVRSGLVCGVMIVATLCVVTRSDAYHPLMSTLGYSATAATSALMLIAVVFWPERWWALLLRWQPLVYTGQIAYGLYLLHGPASWAARSVIGRLWGTPIEAHSVPSVPITLAASFLVAGLSWRFFESPILRLKSRFTASVRPTTRMNAAAS